MSFSFSDDLFTALDRVRAAIGDRDIDAQLRSDEEIEAVLIAAGTTADTVEINASAEAAAAMKLAGDLYREYARKPTSYSKAGGISVSWGNRVAAWKAQSEGTSGGVSALSSWAAPVLVGTGSFSLPVVEG
jgi:hypothetical protein